MEPHSHVMIYCKYQQQLHFLSNQLSLKKILQPAITLAEEGCPISPITAHLWSQGSTSFFEHKTNPDRGQFLINGRAPEAGEVMKMPHLAETFKVHKNDNIISLLIPSSSFRILLSTCLPYSFSFHTH